MEPSGNPKCELPSNNTPRAPLYTGVPDAALALKPFPDLSFHTCNGEPIAG